MFVKYQNIKIDIIKISATDNTQKLLRRDAESITCDNRLPI